MHKFILKHIAAAAVFGLTAASASAVVVSVTPAGTSLTNQGLVSSVGGLACPNISFNDASSLTVFASPTSQCTGVTYTPDSGRAYVSGSVGGQHASPPNDTSVFLTVSPNDAGKSGATPVTIKLPADANYFGFYAASLDPYNYIEFFDDGRSVGKYSGTDLAQLAGVAATGNQGVGFYFNVYLNPQDLLARFDTVELTSTAYAFETDNHSFGIATPPDANVPVPGALALLGIGALGMFGASRRRAV
ncbi:MAG: PEP-CTERM sorting domain-containing protein [Burkholderiales bacterium]|nr:PEP-CTERM sorting domain-containing protein [Burkholderiales bacterium]